MASTLTLQNTQDYAQTFLPQRWLNLAWANNQPIYTVANTVKQTILGAPFAWRWNRAVTTAATVAGTQDYALTLTDFGFLEKGSVVSGSTLAVELEIKNILGAGTATAQRDRPDSVAAQTDDNANSITFRALPVPDAVYTLSLTYQKKATLFSAMSATWAPIPDEFSYIYNYGFLAHALALCGDPRYDQFNQKFVAHLLGAAEGLTEMERDLFRMTHVAGPNTPPEQGLRANVKLGS